MARTGRSKSSPDVGILIAGSASPRDLCHETFDGFAANEVLKLRRDRTTCRVVLTADPVRKVVTLAADRGYSRFHPSRHGNEDGVRLNDRTWPDCPEIAWILSPLSGAGRMLITSSRSGGYVGLTKALQKVDVRLSHVFGSTAGDGVDFVRSSLT